MSQQQLQRANSPHVQRTRFSWNATEPAHATLHKWHASPFLTSLIHTQQPCHCQPYNPVTTPNSPPRPVSCTTQRQDATSSCARPNGCTPPARLLQEASKSTPQHLKQVATRQTSSCKGTSVQATTPPVCTPRLDCFRHFALARIVFDNFGSASNLHSDGTRPRISQLTSVAPFSKS